MDKPFFTVIIPTYNRATFLKEAIQSVLDQTYKSFELLIIDDHSTDNTKDIVMSFNDSRIKYLANSRTQGCAGARNTGIFKGIGEWVAFLDDDDIWRPDKLEKQYKQILTIDKTVGFLYAGYCVYDFEENIELATFLPDKKGWIQNDLLYSNYVTGLPSVVIRRDIVLKVDGFDENFPALEDWELYVRIAGLTKFGILNERLVYIRRSNTDRLSLNLSKKLSAILLFRKKFAFLLRKSPLNCHRIATIILLWSLKSNNWRSALKACPWIFAGIIVNPFSFCKSITSAFLIIMKKDDRLEY